MKTIILLICISLVFGSPKLTILNEKATNSVFQNESYSSGTFPIGTNGSLFYLLFESRGNPDTDPLLIFFTGGSGGGSSLLACFIENGPLLIDPVNLTLVSNPYSWNNAANVMYVEQPLGIGFSNVTSSAGYPVSLDQVAGDFYVFLTEFYEAYPEYNGRELFISGEQVGGRWSTIIGAYIVENNNNTNINLAGITIGDGWINAYLQYPQYANFSLQNGLINQTAYYAASAAFATCQYLITHSTFLAAYQLCLQTEEALIGNPPRFNPYLVNQACSPLPYCFNLSYLIEFVNQPEVLSALGMAGTTWTYLSMNTFNSILPTYLIDVSPEVGYLLDNNIPVLAYYGVLDFDGNWNGGEAWALHTEWSQQEDFQNAAYVSRGSYGVYKNAGPFTFYRVFNTGQLIPLDTPAAALDLISQFLQTKNLDSTEL